MALDFKLTQKTFRGSIPYAEMMEYGTVFQGGEAVESRRLLLCNWNDRYNLTLSMLPRVAIGAATGETLTISKFNIQPNPGPTTVNRLALNRSEPERHPVYPHLFAAHAREIEGVGSPTLDPNTGAMSWSQTPAPNQTPNTGLAKVEITYKVFPYAINAYTDVQVNQNKGPGALGSYESCRYTSLKAKGSIKVFSFPAGGGTFWEVFPRNGQNRMAVNDPGVFQVPQVHLSYTWHMVPKVPGAALSMMGCVNSQVFDVVDRKLPWQTQSYPIGTVLYLHPEISDPYWMVDGLPVVDITYHCIYQPGGHNRFVLGSAGGFVPVYRGQAALIQGPIFGVPPSLLNGQGAIGPPANYPPNVGVDEITAGNATFDKFLRFPPGANLYDYCDLNLLFTIY